MTSTIYTLKLGSMDNFIHIIADDSGKAMVVDPAWDVDAIIACCSANNLTLTGILLTHSHADHISAVAPLVEDLQLPVYISEVELGLGFIKLDAANLIADGDSIALGNSLIRVISTPGHTVGSVCFHVDNHLISGDTLFIDGCGRCNFPESDVEKLWYSLQRLKKLPEATQIYCGHNYGQQERDSIGRQKHSNPYLLIDDKEFFIAFRQHLQSQYRSIPFAPSSALEVAEIYQRHRDELGTYD